MVKHFTADDDALLEELGVEVEAKIQQSRTPREERIIAGFEDIQRFVEEHGHPPYHGEDRDIFERIYAMRLDRLRTLDECRTLIEPLDHQGLLAGSESITDSLTDEIDDEALLAELGVEAETLPITELRHVRSNVEKRMAEDIASRQKCEDFDTFKPIFETVQKDIEDGVRTTNQIRKDAGFLKADIKEGQLFILGGQVAYVAKVGESFKAPNGEFDARLRVIYSNGTESDLLLRSLQRALYKDESSRLVSDPNLGPLFADIANEEDLASGTVYVLRSRSEHPVVKEHRDVLHKIGVTGGTIKKRVANASHDPTFLMADVEIVATYELFNINRKKLENIIHRFFEPARLDIKITDRFGQPIIPREWFLVPLFIVDEVVEKIKEGTIGDFAYDVNNAKLRKTE